MTDRQSSRERRAIKILLVDDEPVTRAAIKAKLESTDDIEVIGEAADGNQAIEASQQLKPDVVLMDVRMPLMDGIEASQRILKDQPEVKVVMLTARDSDNDIFASLSAGAMGYCLKTLESDHLYNAIRSVNAGNIWLHTPVAERVFQDYVLRAAQLPSAYSQPLVDDPSSREMAERLSQRELQVIELIVAGLSNQEIADRLAISLPTAKSHVRSILNKMAVDDRTQAAVQAMRRGLV